MPLYEYQCDKCGHRFERIRKFSDPPVDACPLCGSPVTKLVSSPAFHLKGSGWYATDYAKKGSSSSASEEKSGESKDSAAKDTKESKDGKDSKDSKDTKESKDSSPKDTSAASTETKPSSS